MISPNRQSIAIGPNEGPTFWILDLPGRAKATGQQTGGAFGLVEVDCPAGYATPLHIHYLEDEALYVLEGRLSVCVGGQWVAVIAGGYISLPRDIAHGFRVAGEAPARVLCLTVPAGAGEGAPLGAAFVCPLGPAALELEQLADVVARYKIDILGPLPEPPAGP